MTEDKECFVICPIGSEGSDERERSDKLMEHIIEEAVGGYGYTAVRADQMSDPGSITRQIIQKVVESDLVIADLTGHNPNVFYELAVRHATARPFIQLIDSSDTIPFDLAHMRTIDYDFDVSNAAQASEKISEQIATIEEGDSEFDNPIAQSANFKSLLESEDPAQKSIAELLEGMANINKRLDVIENEVTKNQLEDMTDLNDVWRNIAQKEDQAARNKQIRELVNSLGDEELEKLREAKQELDFINKDEDL
ncbi:hypothetical protein [Salinigranum halophilum]|uniref:hypothetical protein n=1 Tax=Salinigranum halophilum TaxID=2565931 RepID=UPI00115E5EB0|nr:hypothetical protein [Salinigranum halophilum]